MLRHDEIKSTISFGHYHYIPSLRGPAKQSHCICNNDSSFNADGFVPRHDEIVGNI
jgi:hypothetical protein